MTSNWWASKLGSTPAAPARGNSTPPTYRSAEGIRIAAQPPAPPPAYSQQQTIQAPADDSAMPAQMHIMDAIKRFRGSRAANAIESCPACGSPHVFQVSKSYGGASPAPRCTACGWNGLFDQGEQSSWV